MPALVARALLRVTAVALFCAVLVLGSRAASAATIISGGSVGNQTWTTAGSPYIIQGDVTVPYGTALTIQPGVDVQFAGSDGQNAGLDPTRVELTIQGTLSASGTAQSPITFHAQGIRRTILARSERRIQSLRARAGEQHGAHPSSR